MYERTYHKTVLKTDDKPKQKKGLAKVNWKLIAWIAGAAIVLAGFVLIVRLPGVQVKHIEINGAQVVDPGDVTEFVNNALQGKQFWLLPRTSIFMVSAPQLADEIKAAFPRLQTVDVDCKNFSTLSIDVTEYQGVYLWCTDAATCYFMDQNGTVFAPAPYFSGNAYPKLFVGSLQPLPFQALDADQLTTLALLNDRLGSLGIMPTEFHYVTEHDLDVYFVHNGQPAILKFDPTAGVEDEINALFAGLRTDPLATKFNSTTAVLQYIDLRFQDRVVYKFQ